MERDSTKRKADTSDTSQDTSTSSDSARGKKAEFLKRAKKNARKLNGTPSIKEHFTSVSTKVTTRGEMAQGGGDSDVTLSDIMEKLCRQLDGVSSTVQELRGELFEIRQENEKLKTDLERCQKKCEDLESGSKETKHLLEITQKKANDLEQYGRRNNVRFLGVPEPERETLAECEQAVLRICKDKLGLGQLAESDIEACHRVGPKALRQNAQGGRQYYRPIIVRFISRKATEAVLKARRQLKGSQVVVTDDLTIANRRLLTACWDHEGVDDAWSRRGTIYVRSLADGRIKRIETMTELQRLPIPATTSTPIDQRRRPRRGRNGPTHGDANMFSARSDNRRDKHGDPSVADISQES